MNIHVKGMEPEQLCPLIISFYNGINYAFIKGIWFVEKISNSHFHYVDKRKAPGRMWLFSVNRKTDEKFCNLSKNHSAL